MGLAYKLYQHLAIETMKYYKDIGKEVDKERRKEWQNKQHEEASELIDYKALDKSWDNLMQECWDNSSPVFGKKSLRHSE